MSVRALTLDLVVRYGFQVLGALIILVAGLLAARWLGEMAERRMARKAVEPPMRTLAVRALRIVVMLFALVLALDKFGFQVAPLVAGIGVAGLGIGLALQGVLSNIVAGLTIIVTKPFRIGEYIEVVGVHGDVVAIELSSTTLLHPDRSRVIIPNRKIVGEILHNFGTTRQVRLAVGVPRSADLPAVLAVAQEVLVANPRVLRDPAPLVGVSEVSDLAVKIALQPWVRVHDAASVEAELYQTLLEVFGKRGIVAPLPRHEVRLVDGAPVVPR
jgi:small conductance mechanosensitive channel